MNQQVCRCCLAVNPVPAYNIFNGDNRRFVLECVPSLSIEADDGLPAIICGTCWRCVIETAQFRMRCQYSDQVLRCRHPNTVLKATGQEYNSPSEHIAEEVMDLFMAKHFSLNANLADIIDDGNSIADLENLPAFDNLDNLPLFNDLLLADYSSNGVDDSTLNELLSHVVNDGAFQDFATPKIASLESIEASRIECSAPVNNIDSYPTDFLDIADLNFAQVATQSEFEQAVPSPSVLEASYAPTLPLVLATLPPIQQSTELPPPLPRSTKKFEQIAAHTSSKQSTKVLHACTECEKKFTRNFQLKLHMKSVHNLGDGLRYKCGECAKTFASRHSLNYHQKSMHSNERPFGCADCDRRFVLRTQLESHQRIHTGESKPRIFECTTCGKLWPTRSDLRTHMRSHNPNGERRFKCDRCAKGFFTRGHLSSHMLVHTGEKPFLCSFCEKAYQSVGNLNNHMLRRHAQMHDHQLNEASFEI